MKVIIVGGFIETIELCEKNKIDIVGIIDNNESRLYRYLGNDADAQSIFQTYKDIEVVISPDKPGIRKNLVELYNNVGFKIASLISKDAIVSKYAVLNTGVYIQDKSHVSANVIIGNYVRVNFGANIMHDSVIGDFTTIAPNAVVLGRVTIGQSCYIGANSTILPNITIENDCTIGAGAVVTKDIKAGSVVKGVPAR